MVGLHAVPTSPLGIVKSKNGILPLFLYPKITPFLHEIAIALFYAKLG